MRKLMFAAAMLLSFAALSWGQAYVPVTTWYDSKPGAIDFTINSADELAGLAQLVNGTSSVSFEGKTITLGKDIELNDPTDWEDWDENTNDLKQWVPIGGDGKEFKGKFNGNGKVISGLYVNSTSSYQGLFGNVNQGLGSISNLGLVSFYVQGSSKVGGIIGGGGSVINSYAIGNVTLQATFYSYNEGVGGISGHGGNVKNSYFVGKVTGTGDNVGSIVGEYNVFSSERVINSFYNSDFETVTNPFGTPKTTAQMKDGSLYKALNMYARMQNTYNRGNYMDWENNADDYPSFSDQEADYIYMENYFNDGEGTSASPYLIKNKDQLEDLAMLTNAGMNFENTYFKLDADIPLNKTPWTPIGGGSSNAFKGHFDGNGKVISGLYINSTDDYQGLFGYVGWETNISNLGLVDCYVKGNNNVGCISGHDGRIWNSYAIGEVTGVDYVGGMVGNGGRATNSYYVGKIEGTGSNVGIIGDNGDVTHSFYNLDSATVKNSLGTPKTTKEMQSTAFRDLLQIYAGIANQSPYGNDFGWIYNEDGYPSHFSAKAEKVFGVPFLANHDGMLWAPDMELQVQTPGLLKCLLDTPDECDGISIWKTSNVRGSVQITTPIATSGMEVKLETIAAAVDVYNNAKIAFDFQPGAALQDIKNGGGYCISYSSSMPVELALNWMDEFYSDNYYYYTLPKGDNTLNIPWSSFNRDGYEGGEKDNALKEATGLMIRLRSGSNTAASPVKIANFTLKKLGWFGGCGIGYAANTAWYTKDTLAVSFIINTAEELAGLAMLVNNGTQLFNGKTITLGQDIVLNDTNSNSGWQNWATNDGTDLKQWIPIGNGEYQFEGYFNGNGKEISGLYINSSDDYQGLFGYIRYGEVSNLGLVGFYVKGKHAVGGIIGDAWFRSVVNSYAIGNVSSTESSVDGIIGISGSVKNSYFVGKVNNDAKFLYYDNWGDDKSKTLTEMQFIDFRNLLQERAVELNEENANNNYLGWQHNPNGYPSHSGTNAVGNILSIQGDATNNNGAKVCISDNCGKQLGNILDYYMLNSQNNRLELSPNSSSCAMNGNNLVCYGGITLIDYYSGTTGAVNGVHHRAPYTGLSGYYEIYAEIKPVNQGTYLGAEPIKISAFTAGANTQAVWGNISGDDGKFIYNLGAKAKETTSGKLVPIGFASGSWDCPDLNRYGTQNCEFTVYLASATEGGSYGQLVNISVSGDSGLRFFTDSLGLNEVVDYQTFIIPSSKSAGPFPGLLVLWVTSDEAGTYTINDEHQVTVYKNITEGQEPFLPQTFSATYQDGLTLGGITPPLNYSWLEPNTLVYAGSGQEFDATYGPVNYTEPGVGKLTLNVAKASAAPTFVQTNSVNVQYKDGLTLASIPLPNGYEWQSPTTSISTTQVQTFDAWYTDTNYANRASGEITINVFKGDGTVTITGWTYGQESNEPVTNTTTNGAVTIKYTGSEYSGKSYESVNPPDSAGKYQVIATFAAKGDYGQVVASQNFVISKAQGNGSVSIDGRKFGAEANEPVVESETNGKDNVTYLYKSATGTSYASNSAPTNVGHYMLIATFAQTNNYEAVKCTTYFYISKAQAIELAVTWSNDTVFTYNKMVQYPVPTVSYQGQNIPLTLLNAQSEVGKYDGILKARAVIESEIQAQDFVLTNNTKSYEIKQKPLAARFKVKTPTDDFDAKADTIWVPSSIFSNLDALKSTLEGLVDYEGFATDTVKKETDDATVLTGKAKVTLEYAQPLATSHSPLAKRVETTQKATATIITDDVSAKNYALSRSTITVMEAISETDGAEQIFCFKNSKFVLMGENSCEAIGGETVTELFCIVDEECRPITSSFPIAACTEFGYELSQTCETSHNRLPLATPRINAYAIGNTIILQNVPNGAKIDVYNLLGEHVHSRDAMHRVSTKGELQIPVQTKGMYFVRVGKQILRVPVM